MAHVQVAEDSLRQMLKEAVVEALDERRDLIHELLTEVLEDFALSEAIREGQDSGLADRNAVFETLTYSAQC
mgnify:CR=1 FL=1